MRFPIFIINMKTYRESTGRKALELAKEAERVSRELGVEIAVAPQHVDLRSVAESVAIPVYAQSADPVPPGAHTGSITLEAIKDAGARAVILNHSEKPLRINDLAWLVAEAKKLGLETVVCAPDPPTAAAVDSLEPTAVAVEPPELIGTGRAVSRERPEVITNALSVVKRPLIVGAGIESYEDVRRAVELGSKGVLVASAVVKARDWREKILELAKGFIP